MKKIIIIILLTLCSATCQTVFGYEHVYPITAGVKWAQKTYDKQLSERSQNMEVTALPAGAPDFKKAFTTFERNYRLYYSYNDSIFLDESAFSQRWVYIFARRSECYSNMYVENNRNFDQIINWFKGHEAPEAAYDSLYFWTRHIYHNYIIDRGLMRELLDVLIPHYEKTNDTEHLVFCYLCAGYSSFQFARMGEPDAGQYSIDFFQKAYDLGATHFANFKDPLNRYYTLASLSNLVVQHLQTGTRTFDQSHELVASFRALVARPEVQAVIHEDEMLNSFARWALEMYEMRPIVIYINRGINDPKQFDRLYKAYCSRRKEMGDLRKVENIYYARLDYDDLLVEAVRGNITWDEALKRFHEYLAADTPGFQLRDQRSITIYTLSNLFSTYFYIVERTSMSQEQKKSEIMAMAKRLIDVISRIDNIHFPIEKGLIISNLATSGELLKYYNDEEKNELVYRLMIVEQPVTYVHVNMVKELAMAITRTMIDRNPTYFVGMPGLDTEADVRQKGDSLLHLVEQGALYHDLGKIFIPAVVSNSYRRLIDPEFALIKQHPERAMTFFDQYPSIAPYRDVALGHHKWYNGAGYPASFDNRRSPMFQIINIVTIADCLDAATEYFERNYRRPKGFEQVIAEFESQSGTRYDPAVVECIDKNPALYHTLEQMVRLGRFELFLELSKAIKEHNGNTNPF